MQAKNPTSVEDPLALAKELEGWVDRATEGGEKRDEPEGTCYTSFSATLMAKVARTLRHTAREAAGRAEAERERNQVLGSCALTEEAHNVTKRILSETESELKGRREQVERLLQRQDEIIVALGSRGLQAEDVASCAAQLRAELRFWERTAFRACAGIVCTPENPTTTPCRPGLLIELRELCEARGKERDQLLEDLEPRVDRLEQARKAVPGRDEDGKTSEDRLREYLRPWVSNARALIGELALFLDGEPEVLGGGSDA